MDKLLLVDGDMRELRGMVTFLKHEGYEVLAAADCSSAIRLLERVPDVVITDLILGRGDGLEVLREAHKVLPETPVIVATGHGTIANAVEAMKEGAFDYLTKPVNPEEMLLVVKRALERSEPQREVRRLRQQFGVRGDLFGMMGNSEPMRRVFQLIQMAAPTHCTVLVTGASGTGKELVAQALHRLSSRKDGPFVALNCAAIPKDLAESELFGHTRGAFTGATEKRVGKFVAAHHGTLLIDEIGDMEPAVQAKLLRTLETRTITPVGSNEEQPVDVRVIAATRHNLCSLVSDGKFREDLYYRLHVVPIELPSLRQRPGDIPLLVAAFLQQLNAEHGRNVRNVSLEAMRALQSYPWPGNVRELRNLLEGSLVLSRNGSMELGDLPSEIRGVEACKATPDFDPYVTLAELERDAIQRTLLRTAGDRRQTAATLGISTRTLLRKIRTWGLKDPL